MIAFELAAVIVQRGIERGELPQTTDARLVLEALECPTGVPLVCFADGIMSKPLRKSQVRWDTGPTGDRVQHGEHVSGRGHIVYSQDLTRNVSQCGDCSKRPCASRARRPRGQCTYKIFARQR